MVISRAVDKSLKELGIAVFMKDRNGRYTYANVSAAEMLQASAIDVVGADDCEFFAKECADAMVARDQWIMDAEATSEYESIVQMAHADSLAFFHSIKKPLYENGKVSGVIGISIRLTQPAHAELPLSFMRQLFEFSPTELLS